MTMAKTTAMMTTGMMTERIVGHIGSEVLGAVGVGVLTTTACVLKLAMTPVEAGMPVQVDHDCVKLLKAVVVTVTLPS